MYFFHPYRFRIDPDAVSTPIGAEVGLSVEPSNIQIMNKPESEDEEVFNADA